MIDKAEKLREEYYLIKMIPRPKTVKKQQTPKQESTADQNLDLDGDEPDNEKKEDEDKD